MISDWITLISYTGAVISLVSLGIKIGRILQKLDHVIEEVEKLKHDNKEIKTELKDLDKRVIILESKK